MPREEYIGWIFSGFDVDGYVQRIFVSESDLRVAGSGGIVMGRDSGLSDIIVSDPTVSNRHALLLWCPAEGLSLVDLNSTNGTAINGEPIGEWKKPVRIVDGDKVEIGGTTLVLCRYEKRGERDGC